MSSVGLNKTRTKPAAPFRPVLDWSHHSRSTQRGPDRSPELLPRSPAHSGFRNFLPSFLAATPTHSQRTPDTVRPLPRVGPGRAGPGRGGPRGGPGSQPGAVPANPRAATMSCAALLGRRGPRLLGAAARPPRWSRRRSGGCEPPAGAAVRIGCASGFWGDTAAAGRRRGGGCPRGRRGNPAGRRGRSLGR